MEQYLNISIDYARDKVIPEQGYRMLTSKGFYKRDHETSPQQSFARAATGFCFGDYELAQRIYDAVSKQWFTFASPVLSNAVEVDWPQDGRNFKDMAKWLKNNVIPQGMPISCFLSKIGDSKESLVTTRNETAWLSMMGGGIGIYAGNRSPDDKSTGVMAHLRGYDADTISYKQGATRRGSIAAYLEVDHPEIMSFIDMRNPVGGDANKKCFNLNNAVNITDKFMNAVLGGKDYELIDPKHGATGRFLPAREVFEKLLDMRFETGEPYLNFTDTVNNMLPRWITNPNYHVVQSNLCNEIHLMTDDERTAVCCLSSLNLDKYDEWKDSTLVADLVQFLDNVLEYFIQLAPPQLSRAVYSAKQERALGLGTLGFHSYMQRKGISLESEECRELNNSIYLEIAFSAQVASIGLADIRGEAPDCRGSSMRNSHLMAIAPNASSSSLLGVSPSIEPWAANAFTAEGRAGSFLIKNPHLESLLAFLGHDNDEVWSSIILNSGSVQHLTEELTEAQRELFKTSYEVDQFGLVTLAGDRQPNICQGQSVNLFVQPKTTKQYMAKLHLHAWKSGLKGLYYCRNEAPVTASVVSGKPLNSLSALPEAKQSKYNECTACEA